MWVYCPIENQVVNLNPIDENDPHDKIYIQHAKKKNWVMDFYGVKKTTDSGHSNQQKVDPITNRTFFSKCSELFKCQRDKANNESYDSIYQLLVETEEHIIENEC